MFQFENSALNWSRDLYLSLLRNLDNQVNKNRKKFRSENVSK